MCIALIRDSWPLDFYIMTLIITHAQHAQHLWLWTSSVTMNCGKSTFLGSFHCTYSMTDYFLSCSHFCHLDIFLNPFLHCKYVQGKSLHKCLFISNKSWLFSLFKFGLFEKHTEFEKNLPHGFDDLSKPWGIFFQILCVSQKVRTLKYTFVGSKYSGFWMWVWKEK